ncbi:MAG: hypothetical protein M3154_10595 [Candidatus Eremiobacteraeota bacterium]|nr:hypothetical protein [Candidatus Eremiobacteraeota bacterium]
MSEPSLLLSLPENLRTQVMRAADEEDTTPQEWVQRAVARQLGERAWRSLLAYGDQQARALAYTARDVERLIAESRRNTQVRPGYGDDTPPR